MKVVVFDLGQTLMQYAGMPHSWLDFYYEGFEAIIQKFKYPIPQEIVEKSLQMLKAFNPRIHYREIEYSAECIFTKIYPETISVLQKKIRTCNKLSVFND